MTALRSGISAVPGQLWALLLVTLAIVSVSAPNSYSSTTGKISGQVHDAATSAPLVGATVRIEGTSLVTKTDEDGEFFLIGVPIGKYEVLVTHVGYSSKSQMDVRVLVDLTTPVQFELDATTTELNQTQRVVASQQRIQTDLTSSGEIFTSDRIHDLPNATSVTQILTKYPGIVQDADRDIHLRGGRAGQINYYYDGFSVQDPFISTSGIRIMPQALEELSLTSGGFTAEYGEALSGVLNAVTREGGTKYRGSFRSYTGFTQPYDIYSTSWKPLTSSGARSADFDVSGPLFGLDGERYSFFLAGEALRGRGALPHDDTTSYTTTLKISVKPTNAFELLGHLSYSRADGDIFKHRDQNGASFSLNLDGLPSFQQRSYLGGLSGKFVFGQRSIVNVGISRFHTRFLLEPEKLMGIHWSKWPGYSQDANGRYNGTIHLNNYVNNLDFNDPYESVGFAMGDRYDPKYSYRETTYNGVSGSFTSQLSDAVLVKTGIDVKHYSVKRDARQFYNKNPYIEEYEAQPLSVSWYGQQKVELNYLVMNLGLRYDYKSIDLMYNADPLGTPTYKKASPNSRWSPRLGLSFPITVDAVMHFNYGHYYAQPIYQALYFNLTGDVTNGVPLIGNPDLKPEKTVAYELGVDQMISNNIRLDVTAYFKEMSDLVTVKKIGVIAANPVSKYYNGDFGNASGFEFSLTKFASGDFLSGSLSYHYMNARGIGSNEIDAYRSYITSQTDTLEPVTEYPLDFDQRHTITLLADYKVPSTWQGSFAGIPLPNGWGISTAVSVGSGLPYTKTDVKGARLGDLNSGRLPMTMTVDTRLSKTFLFGSSSLDLFAEIDNLFDRRNVLDVYSRTGSPTDDATFSGNGLLLNEQDLERANRLYDYDPQKFGPPRTVRLGLQLAF